MTPEVRLAPRVSFIIAARNAEPHIQACVDSLLNQSIENVQIIVCDDGSDDGTMERLSDYVNEDRVTVLHNRRSRRAAHARNRCLSVATGEFIAIQDADDVSAPSRAVRQLQFLESHPEVAMVGSQAAFFDESGRWGYTNKAASPSDADMLFSLPFVHASLMFRSDALRSVGGYRVAWYTQRNEDYDLILRLYAGGFHGRNVPDVLYEYRVDESTVRRRKYRYRVEEAVVRAKGFRQNAFGLTSIPYVLKPLIVGMVPARLILAFRKRRLRRTESWQPRLK